MHVFMLIEEGRIELDTNVLNLFRYSSVFLIEIRGGVDHSNTKGSRIVCFQRVVQHLGMCEVFEL